MNKPLDFWIHESEFKILEEHCKAVSRTKTDVLRELIRSLKVEEKPSSEGRGFSPPLRSAQFFGE
jgi:hypothetical protein